MAEFKDVLDEAYAAATAAMKKEFEREPESETAYDCGFAWVIVEDARNPFVAWCRKQNEKAGDKHSRARSDSELVHGAKSYTTGWQFWCPGTWPQEAKYRQSIRIWRKGAEAFAETLQRAGIAAHSASRLD